MLDLKLIFPLIALAYMCHSPQSCIMGHLLHNKRIVFDTVGQHQTQPKGGNIKFKGAKLTLMESFTQSKGGNIALEGT